MPKNEHNLKNQSALEKLTRSQLISTVYLGMQKQNGTNEHSCSSVLAALLGAYRFSYYFMGYEKPGSGDSQPVKRALGGVYSAIAAPFTMPFDILANIPYLPLLGFGNNNVTACISGLTFPNQAAVLLDLNQANSRLTKTPGGDGEGRSSAKSKKIIAKKIIANIISGLFLGFVAYCPIHCLLSPETLLGFIKGMHWMRTIDWLDTASVSLGPLGVVSPIQVILQVTTVIALLTAIERAVSKEGKAEERAASKEGKAQERAASKEDKVDAGDIARIVTALGMCVLPILVPALCHLDISAQLILQGLAFAGLFAAIGYACEERSSRLGAFFAVVLALGMCAMPILIPTLCHLDLSGMQTHIMVALFFAMPIVNNVMQAIAGHTKGKATEYGLLPEIKNYATLNPDDYSDTPGRFDSYRPPLTPHSLARPDQAHQGGVASVSSSDDWYTTPPGSPSSR
jgi:hypothetical protein